MLVVSELESWAGGQIGIDSGTNRVQRNGALGEQPRLQLQGLTFAAVGCLNASGTNSEAPNAMGPAGLSCPPKSDGSSRHASDNYNSGFMMRAELNH